MNLNLAFLLSAIHEGPTRLDHPLHLADLRKSGLTDETIRLQRFTDVPPHMIDQLLGFATPKVTSAYLIPFADPRGGWLDFIRLKIFPPFTDRRGQLVKYLQPRDSGVQLYFPVSVLERTLHGDADDPLCVVEGEKKALAVAQFGHPTVGISGVEGWHAAGSRTLLPAFDDIGLRGRLVDLLPDGDVDTNPHVAAAVRRLADALIARGARPRLVLLPATLPEQAP